VNLSGNLCESLCLLQVLADIGGPPELYLRKWKFIVYHACVALPDQHFVRSLDLPTYTTNKQANEPKTEF
jgi:hypothetical protein